MVWVRAPMTGTQCSVTQPQRPIRRQYSGHVIMYRPIRAVTRPGRGAGAGGDATSRPWRPGAGTRPSRRPSRQSLKVYRQQFPGQNYFPHVYLALEDFGLDLDLATENSVEILGWVECRLGQYKINPSIFLNPERHLYPSR